MTVAFVALVAASGCGDSATPPAPRPLGSSDAKPTASCPSGMVLVDGGAFTMGSPNPDHGYPLHRVHVARFCILRTEVTVAQYRACAAANRCPKAESSPLYTYDDRPTQGEAVTAERVNAAYCNSGRAGRDEHPVNCVDYSASETYCASSGWRLPTQREWEFAARGSDGRRYPWGEAASSPKLLNGCGTECERHFNMGLGTAHAFDDGWIDTAPVGSFPAGASPFGALDMAGNVEEWTASPLCPDDGEGAVPCEQKERIVVGGSWKHPGAPLVNTRPASRSLRWRSETLGFRCAADVVTGAQR